MSLQTIQEAAQATIQAISAFSNADVTINDPTILDGSTDNAPYVIIRNDLRFRSEQDTTSPDTTWDVQLTLIEAYTDDETAMNNLRDRTQAIVDQFNAVGTARSAGGEEAVSADVIRADAPAYPVPDPYFDRDAIPVYLARDIIMEVREF